MPHTKSAKKSLRKTAKRRVRNKAARKGIRVQVKQFTHPAKDATPDQLRVS